MDNNNLIKDNRKSWGVFTPEDAQNHIEHAIAMQVDGIITPAQTAAPLPDVVNSTDNLAPIAGGPTDSTKDINSLQTPFNSQEIFDFMESHSQSMRDGLIDVNPIDTSHLDNNKYTLGKTDIDNVITVAATTFGIDPITLKAIAFAESGGNPGAKNEGSTASGLFQFLDASWSGMVKRYGAQYGVSMRDKGNPGAQALMAAKMTQENAKSLRTVLGRDPSANELYLAHFAGLGGAMKALRVLKENPMASSEEVFGHQVVASNPFLQGVDGRTGLGYLTKKISRYIKNIKGD